MIVANNYLEELGEKYKPTKRIHNYLKHYWRHFGDIRHDTRNFLEVGVQTGASLRMWADFFPNATIYGVDIDEECKKLEAERTKIYIASSTDAAAMQALARDAGGTFDVIMDDGSHFYRDQIETFKILFPYIKNGGFYAVEDLGVTHGVHRQIAINAFQELVEGINYYPRGMKGSDYPKVTTFSDVDNYWIKSVVGISFYRYLAIIEKGRNPEDNIYLNALSKSMSPVSTSVFKTQSY